MANSKPTITLAQEGSELKKYKHLYGRDEEGGEKEVQYEVAKVTLQDEVAGVRRVATLNWNYIKVYQS